MVPIICIVGKSEAGKTTLMESLIAELKGRGYSVATVKHDVHGVDLDQPGKDSWRYAQAGSDAVVLSSPTTLALIKSVGRDSTLDEIARLLGADYDLILAEGFRKSRAPKIEVHRKELKEGLLCSPEELMALVTDERLEVNIPQYSFDDAAALVDLLEKRFLASREEEETTLFVNEEAVPMKSFVKEFVSKTLLGMVSALKGVEEPERLDISFRRKG